MSYIQDATYYFEKDKYCTRVRELTDEQAATITTCIVPNEVEILDRNVFEKFANLQTLKLSDNIKQIIGSEYKGFAYLKKLERIIVSPTFFCRSSYEMFRDTPWFHNELKIDGDSYM